MGRTVGVISVMLGHAVVLIMKFHALLSWAGAPPPSGTPPLAYLSLPPQPRQAGMLGVGEVRIFHDQNRRRPWLRFPYVSVRLIVGFGSGARPGAAAAARHALRPRPPGKQATLDLAARSVHVD
jgi:hypothetical protein